MILGLLLNAYLHKITDNVDFLLYLRGENEKFGASKQKMTGLLSMKHQTAP
jgi:hypothetical protein